MYKGHGERKSQGMVLQAVVGMMTADANREAAGGRPLVTTVEASGNDVCAEEEEGGAVGSQKGDTQAGVEEESNPDECAAEKAMHNPARVQRQAVVYRVTSLPLDAYSEAVKNRLHGQREFRAALAVRSELTEKVLKEKGVVDETCYWNCCWGGWF